MLLDIEVHLHYHMARPTDLLLQVEAAGMPDQIVRHTNIYLSPTQGFARIPGEDQIGERIWLHVDGDFKCDYTAQIELNRPATKIETLETTPPNLFPDDVVHNLMPSRYCPADEFQNFVTSEFGALSGGALVMAMRDWISDNIEYVSGSSNAQTTALDSFVQRQGICRDFAHLMITFARAAAIPARFASVYAPNVIPQDFHAVAEVFLEGTWHLVDPTGMATSHDIARIGVGPDAASVAFMTTYGRADFRNQSVNVQILET